MTPSTPRMPRVARMANALSDLDPAIKEELLVQRILDLCRHLHLRTAHFRPARTATGWRTPVQGDGKGWPDLPIVGPDRMIYREVKTDTGRLSPEQRLWIGWLDAAGADVAVWRTRDWEAGTIQAELQQLARGGAQPSRDQHGRDLADQVAALQAELAERDAEIARLRGGEQP